VTNDSPDRLGYKTIPSGLPVQGVLQGDPWKAFYWMLHQAQDWQTGQGSSPSGGQFFSVCPIFYYSDSEAMGFEYAVDWVIAWSLKDQNNKAIASSVAASLFGASPLRLADQNNPLAAAGFGWYCQIAKSGVTTPIDAFMNWGEGVSTYSPQILITEYPECSNYPTDCNLYQAYAIENDVGVMFAAVAALDLPPPALVTLEPGGLNFGSVAIGSSSQPLTAVLTDNQKNSLQNISATSDFSAFVVSAPTDVQAGGTGTISVTFKPGAGDSGPQTGNITISTQGQYGPLSLTLACSGTGVESS
jgi:hypothetical protein